MEKRKTSGKEAKVSEARVAIIERLRNTPADRLSKTAKWPLKKERPSAIHSPHGRLTAGNHFIDANKMVAAARKEGGEP